jgi:hypothetical protein
MTQCWVCGGSSGSFERVTYVGAPEGGVPVHHGCIIEFFRQLDAGADIPLTSKPSSRSGGRGDAR